MTTDFLLPKFEKKKLNENGVFVLAQTMNFYSTNSNPEIYQSVLELALKLNPERWCKWVNNDFQILRNHKIKRIYCESCGH